MRSHHLPLLSPFGTAHPGQARGLPPGLVELMHDRDLDESGAFLAWQLAELPRDLPTDERAALSLLIGRLLAAQATGSTRVAVSPDERALLDRARGLVGRALVLDGRWLYTGRGHACELRVAHALTARLSTGPFAPQAIASAVANGAAVATPPPSDEQRAAVADALGRRLGIITGGPGTGKTTTALLLLRSLARLGVPGTAIALAAPTGKAKSRLEEGFRSRLAGLADLPAIDRQLAELCPPAQTLHHLLGVRAGRGTWSPPPPLPFRAVIVDESSMIDLELMDRLLAALPELGQLFLLGDADQLPSVAAGAVFRDLRRFGFELSRPFRADPSQRAGSQLVALAAAVRAGQAEASAELCTRRDTPEALVHQGVEQLGPEHRDELLRRHYERLAPDSGLFDHVFTLRDGQLAADEGPRLGAMATQLARTRILCVTRQGDAGIDACNAFMHRLAGGGPDFLPGEPVLILRNDYERELWNGDQGFVVRVREPGRAATTAAAFRSRQGWLAVSPRALGAALGPGYALTVHKAQGSEYDDVLLLLPDYACPLLTRELLYTAVSRARQSVIVCGAPAMWRAGVATSETRDSGLAERLVTAAPAPGEQLALFASEPAVVKPARPSKSRKRAR